MDGLNKAACERTKAETMKTPGVPDPLLSSPGFFPERVRLTPDLPAVIYETDSGSETVTWRELLKKAARMQALLKSIPEKTVLLPARCNANYAAAFLGALYLRKTVLPFSLRECESRLAEIRAMTNGVIFDPEDAANKKLPEMPGLPEKQETPDFADMLSGSDPDIPANLLMSSGSSGTPKIIVHSLKNHLVSAENACRALGITSADRYALSLPLNHAGGQAVIFRAVVSGAAMAVPDPRLSLPDSIARSGITALSLVPTQIWRLVNEAPSPEKLRSLKWILAGGAPLSPETVRRFRELYPRVRLFVSYAMTETASLAFLGELTGGPGDYFGKPLPGWSCRISGSLPGGSPDSAGEVLIRGPSLALGCLGTGETVNALPDPEGWFATGDTGIMTPDGLRILGRRDFMFISGGENIIPESVERELLKIPGIREAVVVPLPDPEWGAMAAAVIKTAKPLPEFRPEYEEKAGKSIPAPLPRELRESLKNAAARLLDRIRIPKVWIPWNPAWNQGLKIKRKEVQEYARAFWHKEGISGKEGGNSAK
ncbi:AMP-binding protein [Succinimonas sp.]|uniref:AMP-binding protein n=1 Tax=Succinimonas sp. TaxID=1936151 RepID=UPI00386DA702